MGVDALIRRAVFLDRDGIINSPCVRDGKPYAPVTASEFVLCPDAPAIVHMLRAAGFELAVVTNQPEIARGTISPAALDAMHAIVRSELAIEHIFVCPHDDGDGCVCRKPKPGMILTAARQLDVDLRASFMIGDRWRDVGAGRNAGCRTVLVDYGYDDPRSYEPDYRATSVGEAAEWVIAQP
ncbi:MAG TPA: HAD family hydrolase [Vicinamibacterales bacterium]|nr:HAD family hydrolase [Vicinamibacterales bacterium]